MKIKHLLSHLNTLAPFALAMSWDNCGLQIGDPETEIGKVLLSLDVTDEIVDMAIAVGADVILAHHPLIFTAQKSISKPIYFKIIKAGISVVAMHTNLDVVSGGVNYCLADTLGLKHLEQLSPESGNTWHQLCVISPLEASDILREAICKEGAGIIGNYDNCSVVYEIKGTFRPLLNANPHTGDIQKLHIGTEEKLEFMVDAMYLPKVLRRIKEVHPYETPLLYHYPVANPNPAYGLGLIGEWDKPMSLQEIHCLVKSTLHSPICKLYLAGKAASYIPKRIAICGGAGSSIISSASSKADLLISGDIGYHAYLDSPIPIIDAGHLYTEYPVLQALAKSLDELELQTHVCPLEEQTFAKNII